MKKFKWEGVMPAITTQFDVKGNLDLNTFKINLSHQVNAGVNGIILGGTLGEASTLTNQEKQRLLAVTLVEVNGKIPVIMNIAEQATMEAIRLAQKAESEGADGLMLLPPMRYKATDEETVTYFSTIANATNLPIMIYNNPIDYKIEVTLEMFAALESNKNITAVKESTRDITNITRMINRFGDRFQILCGVDTIAMEALLMGANGWVAGLVDAFPEETVAIYSYCKQGELEKARSIFSWFLPLLELDISPQLVQNIKLCELATGMGTGHVRPPRLPLKGAELERVRSIIKTALDNRPKSLD
ncbi:MAG: dihydrodipicolinate synthase family protein [Flavobacteriaceae bacterium]|nr:dihydrodipicolinate synthase family protein [Flavobacteriaceae bacterium]MDG2235226.1 dihydrodipicolinate synthase family protein [Flavobacteriaceae bacterium]|tara:strand:+ start:6436 stop:7341 length:906 start_codon:yes stop_codon:yes gene_type:complete